MSDVVYPSLFGKCVAIVVRNKNLFVPNLLMVFFSVFLVFMFMTSIGLLEHLYKSPDILSDHTLLTEKIQYVKADAPGWFWFNFGLYLLIVYLVDIFFITVKYGMIRDVLTKGSTTFWDGMRFARENYFKSLLMHVVTYILVISPFFFVAALGIAAGFRAGFFENTAYTIMFVFFIIVVFVYWVEVFFRLIFLYPTMAFGGTNTMESFREDFQYVKSHLAHTFISWMIFILVWIGYFLLKTPFSKIVDQTATLSAIVVLTLLTIASEAVISTFEHTFIFKAYLEGKGKTLKTPAVVYSNWKDIYV